MKHMKQVIIILASFILAISADAEVCVQTVDGLDWTYTTQNGEAIIGNCSAPAIDAAFSGCLTIPSKLGGYPVKGIGHLAFAGCVSLQELTIPDTVTNIGVYAFEGCTNLTRLVIGSGVASIPQCEPVFSYHDESLNRRIEGLPALRELIVGSPEALGAFCDKRYYDETLIILF